MADINALYEELSKLHEKEPMVTAIGTGEPWDVLDVAERLSPGEFGLRFLLDFARCDESVALVNSDEVLARVVKRLDTAIEKMSAIRDVAKKYLPAQL